MADAVLERIVREMNAPTYPESPIGSAPDFLSFVCDQVNFARIIDRSFRSGKGEVDRLPVKRASIRNLNLIAAYELCNCLGDRDHVQNEGRLGPLYLLEKALGITSPIMVLPVTYDACSLYLQYEEAVQPELAAEYEIPPVAIREDGHQLIGQQYIDKLPQPGKRRSTGLVGDFNGTPRSPRANPEYLARLREAELFVMGAGSLVSSQLAQLADDGVVETLVSRQDMRKILVINHVKPDETLGMTLRDQIDLIETVATECLPREILEKLAPKTNRLRIADIFTDVVIPRTVAREVEFEMVKRQYVWNAPTRGLDSVKLQGTDSGRVIEVKLNRYVDFLLQNPDIQERLGITLHEVRVLSYLDYPPNPSVKRTETGRYRGALFATDEDIDYLVEKGIQLRNIHQIDSVGENWKFVKAEGVPSLEFFPGLVPEALMGVFRIALERGAAASATKKSS